MTISLPPRLAREVDRKARVEGRSRSELVREALRQYLNRQERWEQIFAYSRKAAATADVTVRDVARIVKERRRTRAR
ncbi:MAG: CopG family ribbon-helix-helix protein [Actinomycetota bacterium]